jgi:hypothetical protein
VSGGTYTTTTTAANVYQGNQTGAWDSSSASQTFVSSAIAVGSKASASGAVSCAFKSASGTATHTIGVDDGTTLLASSTITSSATVFQRTSVSFTFPSSGNVRLRITSVNANEPNLFIDSCYIGPSQEFNSVQLSQSSFYGSVLFQNAASCSFINNSATYADFSANASCNTPVVAGNATSPGKLPHAAFTSVPAGSYDVSFTATMGLALGNLQTYCRLLDSAGTVVDSAYLASNLGAALSTPIHLRGIFTYATTQSSITFKVQCARGGSSNSSAGVFLDGLTTDFSGIRVIRLP